MSVIQFNLLPDVKLEFIRAKRLKRLLVTISVMVAGASLIIAVLLFLAVNVAQKKHMDDLNKDITTAARQVKNTPDIDRIITVQNQLTSLPALHDDKPAATRLFTFISQVTPANVSYTNVLVDYVANTIAISGTAKDLLTVNTFVDTLKFTTYVDKSTSSDSKKAFSNVLLTSFSSGDKGATFEVTVAFEPKTIFDNLKKIELTVPKTITTRSQIDQPSALFQQSTTSKQGAQ